MIRWWRSSFFDPQNLDLLVTYGYLLISICTIHRNMRQSNNADKTSSISKGYWAGVHFGHHWSKTDENGCQYTGRNPWTSPPIRNFKRKKSKRTSITKMEPGTLCRLKEFACVPVIYGSLMHQVLFTCGEKERLAESGRFSYCFNNINWKDYSASFRSSRRTQRIGMFLLHTQNTVEISSFFTCLWCLQI